MLESDLVKLIEYCYEVEGRIDVMQKLDLPLSIKIEVNNLQETLDLLKYKLGVEKCSMVSY